MTIDRYTARCLAPDAARILIQETAADAVSAVGDLTAYAQEGPYTFEVEFATASTAAGVLHFPQLERTDDRIVTWTHEDYATAYKMFIGVMSMARSDPDYG